MTDKNTNITLDRVTAILEAYGSSPEHWPAYERDAVEDFLSANGQASDLLAEEATLDALLEKAPAGQVSSALREQVLVDAGNALAHRHEAHHGSVSSVDKETVRPLRALLSMMAKGLSALDLTGRGGMRPAGVLGGAAMLGILTGVFAPAALQEMSDPTTDEDIFILALSASLSDFDDFDLDGELE